MGTGNYNCAPGITVRDLGSEVGLRGRRWQLRVAQGWGEDLHTFGSVNECYAGQLEIQRSMPRVREMKTKGDGGGQGKEVSWRQRRLVASCCYCAAPGSRRRAVCDEKGENKGWDDRQRASACSVFPKMAPRATFILSAEGGLEATPSTRHATQGVHPSSPLKLLIYTLHPHSLPINSSRRSHIHLAPSRAFSPDTTYKHPQSTPCLPVSLRSSSSLDFYSTLYHDRIRLVARSLGASP